MKHMLTDPLFKELVKSASLAPSADNMQPWEFRRKGDAVEVLCAVQRMLPTDVSGMFTWVSIGAAIQNMVVESAAYGFKTDVAYSSPANSLQPVATIRLSPGNMDVNLAEWIPQRATNRNNYRALPIGDSVISALTQGIHALDAGIHWMTKPDGFRIMAKMDANSSFIRLEHKPFHDELFDILRFSRTQVEASRYGLDYESIGIPAVAVFFARQLKHWSVNKTISKSGMGKLIAKMLSMRLLKSGALCLITAKHRDPAGYMEAGRAMEQLWLTATAKGLSSHPYGALPQYLTKAEVEPESFLPRHLAIIRSHRGPFYSIFPGAEKEYPAIVLRMGFADKQSGRSDIRLRPDEIAQSEQTFFLN
jgi:nitroreductase